MADREHQVEIRWTSRDLSRLQHCVSAIVGIGKVLAVPVVGRPHVQHMAGMYVSDRPARHL